MSAKIVREQYRDAIDQQQPDKMLNSLVSKVLQNSKPKSKYIDSFQSPKLPLSPKKSVYEDSYKNRPNFNGVKISFEPQQRKLITIVSDSSYQSQFSNKTGSQQLMMSGKRKDNIKLGGPLYKESTYKKQYPEMSYMPPKQTLFINPQNLHSLDIKLKNQSAYAQSYKGRSVERVRPIKKTDYLKVNGSFIGSSTYKQGYQTVEMNKAQSFSPKNVYRPTLSFVVPSKSNIITASYQSDFAYKKFTKDQLAPPNA